MPIAKCLATLQPYTLGKLTVQATNIKLEISSLQQYYMHIQIVLKEKRTLCGDRSGFTHKIWKTVRGCVNSKLQIQNEVVTLFSGVSTNSFTRTSYFVRICEDFQHVMLRTAGTLSLSPKFVWFSQKMALNQWWRLILKHFLGKNICLQK